MSNDLLLPGRDFHLPAQIGEWSPKKLNDYLRMALQNDPSILPQQLKANTVNVTQEIFYNGQTIIDVIGSSLPGPGLAYTGKNGKTVARWQAAAGSDAAMAKAMGSNIIGVSWDRARVFGMALGSATLDNGTMHAAMFYVTEDAIANNVYTWQSLAQNWGASTGRLCKAGIYGPITPANAAAVPLLIGSASTEAAVTSAGLANGTGYPLANTLLLGGNLYAVGQLLVWSGAVTTQGQFYIPPNNGALSGNNDYGQGKAALGTLATMVSTAGLTDLPTTIDLSATRSTSSAPKSPYLIITI